jgi:hypothetical protein
VALLTPVVEDPGLPQRVAAAGEGDASAESAYSALFFTEPEEAAMAEAADAPLGRLFRHPRQRTRSYPEPTPLQQVVGVVLGSPEFQRR